MVKFAKENDLNVSATNQMWHRYDAARPNTHVVRADQGGVIDANLEVDGVAHLLSSRLSRTPQTVLPRGMFPNPNVGTEITHVNASRGWYGYAHESGAFGVKIGFTTYGRGLDTGINETIHLYGSGDAEGRYRYLYYDRLGGGNGDDEGTSGSSDQMIETRKIPIHTIAAVDDNQHLSLNNAITGAGGGSGHMAVLVLSADRRTSQAFATGNIEKVGHEDQLQTLKTDTYHDVSRAWGTAKSESHPEESTSGYTIATPPNLDFASPQQISLKQTGGTSRPSIGYICFTATDRFERAKVTEINPKPDGSYVSTALLRNAMGGNRAPVYWFQGPGCDAPHGGGVIAKVDALTNGTEIGDTSQVLRIAGFPTKDTAVYVINGNNEFRSIYSVANNILPETIPVHLSREKDVVTLEGDPPSDWCERSGIVISAAEDSSFNGTFTVSCRRAGYSWLQSGISRKGVKAIASSDRHRQHIGFYPAAEVIGVTDPTNKQRVYANFVELENNDLPWATDQTIEIDKTGYMPARKTFDVLECYSAGCSGYQGIFSGTGVRGQTDINGVGFTGFNYGNTNDQKIYEGFGGPYKLPSYLTIGDPWKTYFDLANPYAQGGSRVAAGATLFNLPCPTHLDGMHDCSYANDRLVLFRMCTAYWNCIGRPPVTFGVDMYTGQMEFRSGDNRLIASWGRNYQLGDNDSSSGLLNGSVTVGKDVSVRGKVNSSLYVGPEKTPTGRCDSVGWAFSQDGHAAFCDGTMWVPKI